MRGIPSVSRTTKDMQADALPPSPGQRTLFSTPRTARPPRRTAAAPPFRTAAASAAFSKVPRKYCFFWNTIFAVYLPASFINASVAGRVVGGALAAAKCFDAGSVDMRQQLRHLRVMTPFLAAAAFHISINQVVVRYVNFSSAVAAAVPDDASTVLCFRWVPRREPEKRFVRQCL